MAALIAQVVTLGAVGLLMAYLAGFSLGVGAYGLAVCPLLFAGASVYAVCSLIREHN